MKPSRLRTIALWASAIVTVVALIVAPATLAKGGKVKAALAITKPVGAMVPEAAPDPGPYGLLTSTIDVGKRYRGRLIRDVNVTVQTTGVTGNNPSNDLSAYVTAPNGATTALFFGLGGIDPGTAVSIGPLTLDDDTPIHLFSVFNPGDPLALKPPFAGTAMPEQTLASLEGGPVRGTWALRVVDDASGGAETSRLDLWGLSVLTGKAYREK
jgi:hypothetical protein